MDYLNQNTFELFLVGKEFPLSSSQPHSKRVDDVLNKLCEHTSGIKPIFVVSSRSILNAAFVPAYHGIVITESLIDKASDDQLAYILGHELGHIINGDARGFRVYEKEIAADAVGLQLAFQAGYDVSAVVSLMEDPEIKQLYSLDVSVVGLAFDGISMFLQVETRTDVVIAECERLASMRADDPLMYRKV